jgi:hypothetical protein
VQTSDEFQTQVIERLTRIETDIDQRFNKIQTDIEKLDFKFDTYQKASDQVVRLATTIIVAAASVIILSPVLQSVAPAIAAFFSHNLAS